MHNFRQIVLMLQMLVPSHFLKKVQGKMLTTTGNIIQLIAKRLTFNIIYFLLKCHRNKVGSVYELLIFFLIVLMDFLLPSEEM